MEPEFCGAGIYSEVRIDGVGRVWLQCEVGVVCAGRGGVGQGSASASGHVHILGTGIFGWGLGGGGGGGQAVIPQREVVDGWGAIAVVVECSDGGQVHYLVHTVRVAVSSYCDNGSGEFSPLWNGRNNRET